MSAIFWKEMADHFGRRRFVFLLTLVCLAIIWALSVIFSTVQDAASTAMRARRRQTVSEFRPSAVLQWC